MVEAVAVVVKSGFGIVVFCRETVAEEIGERAGLCDGVANGIVCVLGNCVTGRVEVTGYVSVVVVAWNVDRVVGG